MEHMGFDARWVDLIMKSLYNVILVSINGKWVSVFDLLGGLDKGIR